MKATASDERAGLETRITPSSHPCRLPSLQQDRNMAIICRRCCFRIYLFELSVCICTRVRMYVLATWL